MGQCITGKRSREMNEVDVSKEALKLWSRNKVSIAMAHQVLVLKVENERLRQALLKTNETYIRLVEGCGLKPGVTPSVVEAITDTLRQFSGSANDPARAALKKD
jgi:hypothetical protein